MSVNAGNFYSRRTTAPRSRSNKKSAGATPTGSSTVDHSSSRQRPSGHRRPLQPVVECYGPGQDLLDFDLTRLRDGCNSGSSSEDGGGDFSTPINSVNITPLSRPRVERSTQNNDMASLLCLLQQQQATLKRHGELLEENLHYQQTQSRKLDELEEKFFAYEERLDDMEVSQINKPPKKKIKVTRDLSVSWLLK